LLKNSLPWNRLLRSTLRSIPVALLAAFLLLVFGKSAKVVAIFLVFASSADRWFADQSFRSSRAKRDL
jgi:hypothetical protein